MMLDEGNTAADSIKRGFFFALGALMLKLLVESLEDSDG